MDHTYAGYPGRVKDRKIVFHSGMNPYVYYKESWAENEQRTWTVECMKKADVQACLDALHVEK